MKPVGDGGAENEEGQNHRIYMNAVVLPFAMNAEIRHSSRAGRRKEVRVLKPHGTAKAQEWRLRIRVT